MLPENDARICPTRAARLVQEAGPGTWVSYAFPELTSLPAWPSCPVGQ